MFSEKHSFVYELLAFPKSLQNFVLRYAVRLVHCHIFVMYISNIYAVLASLHFLARKFDIENMY